MEVLSSPQAAAQSRYPLAPKPWISDAEATSCTTCGSEFGVVNRRHHCRGCGQVFCGNDIIETSMEQYGILDTQKACKQCAAPFIKLSEDPIFTAGGPVLLTAFNTGYDVKDLEIRFNDGAVPAEFVKTKQGMRLRVDLPPGTGGNHTLSVLRTSGVTAKLKGSAVVSYSNPAILRVGEMKTEGGEIKIHCENIGTDPSLVRVSIDGFPCSVVVIEQPHKVLSCVVPPGVGLATVRVEVGDLHTETEVPRCAPEIIGVEPRDIPLTGGPVVFRGSNFGTDPSRLQVILPDLGIEGAQLAILQDHTKVECVLPALTDATKAGENIRVTILAGGVKSIPPAFVVYSASARAAKQQSKLSPSKATPSPYANLFATPLSMASDKGVASPGAPAATSSSPAVRVGGTLAGGGPTLSIASPRNWQNDTPDCSICKKEFGISRRRHHCRVCGVCACASCTSYQLQLAPTKPAVRVCTRCNLRVGLLTQMVSIIDAITALRKVLPAEMYDTFKEEVVESVSAPIPLPAPTTPAQKVITARKPSNLSLASTTPNAAKAASGLSSPGGSTASAAAQGPDSAGTGEESPAAGFTPKGVIRDHASLRKERPAKPAQPGATAGASPSAPAAASPASAPATQTST